jgi:hypothetical protein
LKVWCEKLFIKKGESRTPKKLHLFYTFKKIYVKRN